MGISARYILPAEEDPSIPRLQVSDDGLEDGGLPRAKVIPFEVGSLSKGKLDTILVISRCSQMDLKNDENTHF